MADLDEGTITDAVLEKIQCDDPRLQTILTGLITHLHAFIREVEPTEAEWLQGIEFLTRTGHMCDDTRQEFILLSDTLGVSILVDAINHRQPGGATETTVLGPFHVTGAKALAHGTQIASTRALGSGEPTIVRNRITDSQGMPIAGAKVDIWQTSADGKYDIQMPGQETDLRGIFETNANGEIWYKTIKPASYPIPDDGPVGDMLRMSGRHPYRPAHIHYMISAPGYETLITHVFVAGDEYLDSDAVFAVKRSLIAAFVKNNDLVTAHRYGFDQPFYELNFDFGLKPLVQNALQNQKI